MGEKKILVIDDEADILDVVSALLKFNGYEVDTAGDGLEGLEKASLGKPDLILLDIKMAQVDGYTVLRKLKQNQLTKHIPVIVMTVYDKMRDLFEAEGIADYIVKPYDDQDLLLRVARIIKEGKR
ncbi:MAG: response regulator [Candidatus Omnitrophota bacterium]